MGGTSILINRLWHSWISPAVSEGVNAHQRSVASSGGGWCVSFIQWTTRWRMRKFRHSIWDWKAVHPLLFFFLLLRMQSANILSNEIAFLLLWWVFFYSWSRRRAHRRACHLLLRLFFGRVCAPWLWFKYHFRNSKIHCMIPKPSPSQRVYI